MKIINTTRMVLMTVLILGQSLTHAQTKSNQTTPPLSYGAAAEVGVSEERLARIDAMCLEAIADGDIPGVVALVARNGKIVYNKAFGPPTHPPTHPPTCP